MEDKHEDTPEVAYDIYDDESSPRREGMSPGYYRYSVSLSRKSMKDMFLKSKGARILRERKYIQVQKQLDRLDPTF